MKYEVYQSRINLRLKKLWYWRLVNENGKVLKKGKTSADSFMACVASISRNSPGIPVICKLYQPMGEHKRKRDHAKPAL
jgi:uncharacterized protein YegP (UPF0339 family)